MGDEHFERTPVSLVCVFNDAGVLSSCLQSSFQRGTADAPETELIVVDNREGRFATAGSALNFGARRARNPVIAFVHQDVVLHSLSTLERAAALLLRDPGIGLLGAVGIDGSGHIVGRMRDRIVQIGEPAPTPAAVETLDEVLLMATSDRLTQSPLSEDPLLAWHAYGVEYACRVRREGLIAAAVDVAITHNSLTVNLARLTEAHHRVRDEYIELLPIHTTCGTIGSERSQSRLGRAFARRHGAVTWWHESRMASRLARRGVPSVLADIRLLVDDAVRLSGRRRLTVVDAAPQTSPGTTVGLSRFGVPFSIEHATGTAELAARLGRRHPDETLLLTGLDVRDAAALSARQPGQITGYWRDTGLWVLAGVDVAAVAPLWNTRRNLPYAGLLAGRARTSLA